MSGSWKLCSLLSKNKNNWRRAISLIVCSVACWILRVVSTATSCLQAFHSMRIVKIFLSCLALLPNGGKNWWVHSTAACMPQSLSRWRSTNLIWRRLKKTDITQWLDIIKSTDKSLEKPLISFTTTAYAEQPAYYTGPSAISSDPLNPIDVAAMKVGHRLYSYFVLIRNRNVNRCNVPVIQNFFLVIVV